VSHTLYEHYSSLLLSPTNKNKCVLLIHTTDLFESWGKLNSMLDALGSLKSDNKPTDGYTPVQFYAAKLFLVVNSATGLPPKNKDGLTSDPYAIVKNPQGKKIFESSVIEKNLNPVWNEVARMDVARGDKVEIFVYSSSTGLKDILIGKTVLEISVDSTNGLLKCPLLDGELKVGELNFELKFQPTSFTPPPHNAVQSTSTSASAASPHPVSTPAVSLLPEQNKQTQTPTPSPSASSSSKINTTHQPEKIFSLQSDKVEENGTLMENGKLDAHLDEMRSELQHSLHKELRIVRNEVAAVKQEIAAVRGELRDVREEIQSQTNEVKVELRSMRNDILIMLQLIAEGKKE